MMVRHIVMWRVKGDSAEERAAARERVKAAFESLRGCIPGMQKLEVGPDYSGVDCACDAVLVTEFDSQVALDASPGTPSICGCATSGPDFGRLDTRSTTSRSEP